jgi:ribosome-associated translation inhibitor RaiA
MVEDNAKVGSKEHTSSHAPARIAEICASALATGDVDELMGLYAPRATVHAGADVILGPGNIRDYWRSSPTLERDPARVALGEHGIAILSWPPADEAGHSETVRLRIRHGKIVEQWAGDVHASVGSLDGVPIELSVSGRVSQAERAAAVDMIEKVLRVIDEPVQHVRLRLERSGERTRVEPVSLRVTIDLKGDAVRAHVTSATSHGANDALESRLRARLRQRSERRRSNRHRGASSGAGEWRHGDEASQRSPYYPRPVDERQVVRYKTVAPGASTVEEAMFDLESMDYDFYLFVDADTGDDACVERSGRDHDARDVHLHYLNGAPKGADDIAGVIVEPHAAPFLDLDEAEERLDLGDDRCVFFRDAETGRGQLLYRRYDGHYGLIVPADDH